MLPELDEYCTDNKPPIRIPLLQSVPTSERLRELIDHPLFQRLRWVRQLGPTHLVCPGAVHTRFEHSLGTYDLARLFALKVLAVDPGRLDRERVTTYLLAALLHDLGQFPYSHAVEEMGLANLDANKRRAARWIREGREGLGALIDRWQVDRNAVADLLEETRHDDDRWGLVQDMLTGPINPDRLDFLRRDSHHAAIPYGQVIDIDRLLLSLRVTDDRELGITEKGIAPFETYLFAYYLMHRELYWHHTVRACMAMYQWATWEAIKWGWNVEDVIWNEKRVVADCAESAFLRQLGEFLGARKGQKLVEDLLHPLDGTRTGIYKRVQVLTNVRHYSHGGWRDALVEKTRNLNYEGRRDLGLRLAGWLRENRTELSALEDHHLLIDLCTTKEVSCDIEVRYTDGATMRMSDARASTIASHLAEMGPKLRVFTPERWVCAVRKALPHAVQAL